VVVDWQMKNLGAAVVPVVGMGAYRRSLSQVMVDGKHRKKKGIVVQGQHWNQMLVALKMNCLLNYHCYQK